MPEGIFKYENDLLKHYVRSNAWLPLCRERSKRIKENTNPKMRRKLRYFTFCAIGAVDVLMLDVANIIRPSKIRGFDTVYFFDITKQYVFETNKRIPGAIGFPGDFVKIVLLDDPDEESILESQDSLKSPREEYDVSGVRERQALIAQRQQFIKCFPFDVINLDLEEFLFKPNDPFPGKVINSLRRIFSWQQKPLTTPQITNYSLDGFSLMFTTQIGPPNISNEYLEMLKGQLDSNISSNSELRNLLHQRTGFNNTLTLQNNSFDEFFKLAMPKLLAQILMEEDWYIDSDKGILIYEYERSSESRSYKMLHLAMDVKRKNPPRERRSPGVNPNEAVEAYQEVVRQIFERNPIIVTENSLNKEKLQNSLDNIKARRRKYFPDEESITI